ncbi:hypothetical protein AAEO56_15080 [Flavobacterium sp. DGU11]|uniref:DUF4019 domain-containing protein n=1 Tax=Flavobacterium arundinis TaxID=3139143 RepID=A0ABU9HZK8_9FLAO
MRNIYLGLTALSFCLFLAGCRFNATRTGQLSDKSDGDAVANKLFSALSDHDYSRADKLFGEEFFKATPLDSLHHIFDMTTKKLGGFKSNKLLDWNTSEISGTDERTEYLFVYEVEYEKYSAKETIRMLKKADEDDIKILRYDIDSQGFIK